MADVAVGGAHPSLLDRALGAYLGFAIGDALGATVEFMTEREIAHQYGTHRQITGGGWLSLRAGQVTDDTTMSLALGEAIVRARGWDAAAAAECFADWLRAGPVDCGHTCRRGIRRYMLDGSLQAEPNEGDAGNGALMRNLPVVLAFLSDDETLARVSVAQGHITHNHPLSDIATVTLARMTAALLRGEAADGVRDMAMRLAARERSFRLEDCKSSPSAYVVDTVRTVLHHFMAQADFEQCLVAVVNRGGDADTTGALAGMLAGARCGVAALPRAWLRRLDPDIRHRIEVQVRQLLALQRSFTVPLHHARDSHADLRIPLHTVRHSL
ncbi:MAG: ADP-ribosyl-[dinitrogen reductase] hydrolase [Rhodocyclaceae bacterium]